MKRFACRDIIPGCGQVFTGEDDQSVLDQVIAHAAEDHGLVKPPLALVELVVATTHSFTPQRQRGHLRLVGVEGPDKTAAGGSPSEHPSPAADQQPPEPAPPAGTDGTTRNAPGRAAVGVLRVADDRFAARGQGGTGLADPAAPEPHRAVHDSYRHECVFYRGVDDFVGVIVPFIREGLALGQPIMVAVAEPRLSAVRRALGDDADRVRLADMAELGHNPARIIPAWREFTRGAGGRPIRGVGEPIWSGRRNAEIVECQFHEALLNMAVAPTTPLWLLCPYDVGSLDDAVLAEARHSHPVLVESGDSTASSDYGDISHVLEMFAATLPEPQTRVTALTVAAERHHEVADRVQSWAATAGLPAQQSTKLAVAIDEIARAGIGSDGRDVNLRFWRDEAALVCEVTDAGVIGDPMVGRSEFFATDSRDRGIRIANELCDLVQVRSNSAGTAVRVHSWL